MTPSLFLAAVLAFLPASLPSAPGAAPATRTTVLVFEGRVEISSAGGVLLLGPGEAGEVGTDGRPLTLGGRATPGTGHTRTWFLPLEGHELLIQDRLSGQTRRVGPGQIASAGPRRGIHVRPLTPREIRRLLPSLAATLPPGASAGEIDLYLPPGPFLAFGLGPGETAVLLSSPSAEGPSETAPLVALLVAAETAVLAAADTSPIAAIAPDTLAAYYALEEIKIRQLFLECEGLAEDLKIQDVVDRTIGGALLEGKPYQDYADILLYGGRKVPPKWTDVRSLAIDHFISRIAFTAVDRATVDVVGSSTVATTLTDVGTFTESGQYRFEVRKIGARWYIGEGDILTIVIDSPLVTLDEFGISLR